MKWNRVILIVLVFLLPSSLAAQTDNCIVQLQGGMSLYDQNEFDECIYQLETILSSCEFDKQEHIAALKTLILCYLSIDALERANRTAEKVIELDPLYEPDLSKEDPRLLTVFSRYRSIPSLRVGFAIGLDYSTIFVSDRFSMIHQGALEDLGSYTGGWGYSAGVFSDLRIGSNWWFHAGLGYKSASYSHELFELDGGTVDYTEDLDLLTLPVLVKRELGNGTIRPYAGLGIELDYLNQALSLTSRGPESDIANRTDLRNQWNLSAVALAGVAMGMGPFQFSMDLSYAFQMRKLNDPVMRFADELNSYKYFYVDDDMSLGLIQLNLRISQTLRYRRQEVH